MSCSEGGVSLYWLNQKFLFFLFEFSVVRVCLSRGFFFFLEFNVYLSRGLE